MSTGRQRRLSILIFDVGFVVLVLLLVVLALPGQSSEQPEPSESFHLGLRHKCDAAVAAAAA